MEHTSLQGETVDTMKKLYECYIKVLEENKHLKQEIAFLKAQLSEKDARLMEAKCSPKQ